MSDFTIVFIHGYTSSSLADWYPNITPELNKLNINFIIPDLPGGKLPHAAEWLETLHKIISPIQTPLVLVGHSLGTRAALLYIEKYQPKVEKVVLIAPLSNHTEHAARRGGDAYPDFFGHKIDIEKIKPLVEEFIVMHSKDDDSIPYEQGVELAKDLDAELITYEDRGHFYKPENAPFVLEVLQKKLNF